MPPSKKKRTASDDRPIPADPLKKVPRTLCDVSIKSGFIVSDLVVVMKILTDLFDLHLGFCGPCEGSIKIREQSDKAFDKSTWITDKQKAIPNCGIATELRFSHSSFGGIDGNECDQLRCMDTTFQLMRRSKDVELKMTDTHSDVLEKVLSAYSKWSRYKPFTDEEMRRMLSLPMPLALRGGFPHYSWPRWLFGAFEGLVMRRVQIKHAHAHVRDDA